MKSYAIGLVGWGTVGGGVIDIINRDAALISQRCGLDLHIKAIVTRSPERAREQERGGATLSSDLDTILNDPEIETVIHLVGGTTAAKDIALACLRAGKHLVTANKALIAEHWDELFAVANEHQRAIAFEAAVAGGIPIIAALRDGLVANRVDGIEAILNGTCNYILTQMEVHGLSYDVALAQAQELGYAEADPTLDVNGTDTAHKLAILARIAYNTPVTFADVRVEGIESITAEDIASASRLGCRIKLLGLARERDEGLELSVAPCLVPLDNPMAGVNANYNAVRVLADNAGPTLLVGQGAGALPTASAVLADLVDIATGRHQQTAAQFGFFH
ncbi:MAG: homoserine dehydrogenase, partial [Planctomycetota bacterium]